MNNLGAFQWWSMGLREISALSAKSTELGDFVVLLSTLPLEILALILAAGESKIYRSALLRHVIIAQVASVISKQTKLNENPQDNCANTCKPALEFLGNRYKIFEDTSVTEPLGVDHLGVRFNSKNCPWYLQNKDLELCYKKYALLRYFPLNKGHETVNQIWVRETQHFPERTRTIMIRTSQRTEIFGLDNSDRRSNYIQLTCGATTALLYHVPAYGDPISVFGAVSQSPALQPTSESPEVPNGRDMPSMYNSQASLRNVASVELYIHILEDARCSGILITHDDGREEALGQRRIGLPNIQPISISRPSQIHYRRFQTSNGHWRLNIMFSTDDNPRIVDVDDGWLGQSMMGTAIWSFDWCNDQFRVFDAE
ncbi:hypothetical protein B7463_g2988, partial [Scytalidium lignicola]